MRYLLILIISLSYIGCKSAYETISKTPPKDLKEKNLLAKRCAAEFPADITPVILPTVPDSSDYFKAIADSMAKLKPTVIEKLKYQYRDTCKSAVDQYEQGFDLGLKIGITECKSGSEAKFKTLLDKKDFDCNKEIQRIAQADAYLLGACRTDYELLQQENDKLKTDIVDKSKKIASKNTELWVWRIVAIILLTWQGFKFFKRINFSYFKK